MKKRLVSLSKLYQKEMSIVKAGAAYEWCWPPDAPDVDCGCNCLYADSGGASIVNNGKANKKNHLLSPDQ
jgi:hypothetical protein